MVMVRRFVLVILLSATFSARAWADNPDCARFEYKDPDLFLEAAFGARMLQAIGCKPGPDFSNADKQLASLGFYLDLPGVEPSQILSAYYVERALDSDIVRERYGAYLLAGYDARRLDAKKLEAEIAARKLSPESATNVRAVFKKAKELDARMVNSLAKEKDEHFDYKKLFIEIPEAAAVAWEKFYADHKDVYDLGTSIEKQLSATDLSHRGYQSIDVTGCKEMHKKFADYVTSTQKGKLPPEIRQFLQSDPLAFEMVAALSECDGLRGFKADAGAEYKLIEGGRIWRGPRTAGVWAAEQAANDISAKTSWVSPVHNTLWTFDSHTALHAAKETAGCNFNLDTQEKSAKVANMKTLGDGWVEVSFKVDKWMEPDFECVDVKPLHFNHWGQNGQPVYDWKCHVSGYHEEKNEVAPQAFSEVAVDGVKPGMLVKMQVGSQRNKPEKQAFPIEVSIPAKTKKDKAKLVSFSGIKLP